MNPRELQLEKQLLATEKERDELRQRYEPQRITIRRKMPAEDLLVGDVVMSRYLGTLDFVTIRRRVLRIKWHTDSQGDTVLLVTTVDDNEKDEKKRAATELATVCEIGEMLDVEREVKTYHD